MVALKCIFASEGAYAPSTVPRLGIFERGFKSPPMKKGYLGGFSRK